MEPVELANGIVVFEDAIEIDQDFLNAWVSRRRETEPEDFTINEDGNYVNRGGYIFTPEQYQSAPGRILNLYPEGVTEEDKNFVEMLDNVLYECLLSYIEIFPEVAASVWWRSPGHVATYKDGQHMGSHHDNGVEYVPGTTPEQEQAIHNVITGSVALNEDYLGGQLQFSTSGISIRPPTGTVVLYPSNYIGAHSVLPVDEGNRYSYLQFFGQGTPKSLQGETMEWFPNLLSVHDQVSETEPME
jgi:hypothetical protein